MAPEIRAIIITVSGQLLVVVQSSKEPNTRTARTDPWSIEPSATAVQRGTMDLRSALDGSGRSLARFYWLQLHCVSEPLVLSFACVAGLGPPFGMRLVPAQAASFKRPLERQLTPGPQATSHKHQATSIKR